MTTFHIAATYDLACPWCFIAKRQLERGISLYQKSHPLSTSAFHVSWRPFQLNPAAPFPGIDKEAYSLERFGDPHHLAAMHAPSIAIGAKIGITFKEGGKTGNTRMAHRLVSLAGTKGENVQSKVMDELFGVFHEREGDITSTKDLSEAGERAGLEREEVRRLLESNEREEVVEAEIEDARRNGISGVPHFRINDAYEVHGAQDAEAFMRLFERIQAAEGARA